MISATSTPDSTTNIFINSAHKIGAELCRTAIWHKKSCNWMGLHYDFEKKQEYFKSLGNDFYAGTSGISFFLNHLYEATGEKIFGETAAGALNHAQEHASLRSKESFGFYNGNAGVIYLLLDYFSITKKEYYLTKANDLLKELIAEDITNADADIISGIAGCIHVLLYAYVISSNNSCLDKAIELGNYLTTNAKTETTGISWKTLDSCDKNLTGFSHGAAGIGLSLLLLFSKTKEIKFKHAAERAFAYEDLFFNEQLNNWPDFRTDLTNKSTEISYANAWCHGAPGIGLSRLLAYQLTKKEKYLSIAEKVALAVLENLNSCNNFSLCHGRFGNAELPLLYSRITSNQIIKHQIEEHTAKICTEIKSNGGIWKCGNYNLREEPGLLCGIAGIGNYLIRMSTNYKYDSGLYIESFFHGIKTS